MSSAYAVETVAQPAMLKPPESVAEVGMGRSLLEDLALKTMYVTQPASLVELASAMRLKFKVVDELFRRLRAEQLTEVIGMTGNTRQIALSGRGRSRALELLAVNQYVGAAPVSLESYVEL